MAGKSTAGVFPAHPPAANQGGDDDEEDLLADDSPRSMNVKTFDVLAGLKNRMSALSPPKQSRRSSMLPVPEDMEMPAASFHSPSGSDRRQSVLSVGNGNGNVRRSFGTYGNNNYNGNNGMMSYNMISFTIISFYFYHTLTK